MKLTGNNAHAYLGFYEDENVIEGAGDQTAAGTFYFILKKGAESGLPESLPAGTFFKSPASADQQMTFASGDRLLRLDPERLCKTSASFTLEQGSVDVGDDCDPGAQILDGIVAVSGSVSGLFRYDEDSGDFDEVTDNIINHFLPVVEDNGNGAYTRHPRDDSKVFLLALLNANAKAGQVENWLFVPINISSIGLTLGNTEGQTQELSWTKGEGEAVKYSVPKAA